MNTQGKRKLPDDTPIDFVKKRIRPIVVGEEGINKHAWESALVSTIRNEIKPACAEGRQVGKPFGERQQAIWAI